MTAVRHSVPSDSDASYDVTDDLQDKATDSRTSQTVIVRGSIVPIDP
jgi:hypothetical protein